MAHYTYDTDQILDMLCRCDEEHNPCTRDAFDAMEDTCSSATVVDRLGSWGEAKKEAGISDSGINYTYSREEILEMLRQCKEENGVCTPRLFNGMDDTCSSSAVMKRFGSWTGAKEEAGIDDDASSETGRKREYEDSDILQHIRACARVNGKATVRLLQEEKGLVSPSVAVERFGSWSEAKKKAGLGDERSSNSRPRQHTDEEYLEMLRECEEEYGKVTQRLFNEKDEFPTSGAVRKRFADDDGKNGWSRAKEEAGVGSGSKQYSNEELLEQLRECERRHGSCSAAKFAADDDFASPETLQRRFGSWSEAKKQAKSQCAQ